MVFSSELSSVRRIARRGYAGIAATLLVLIVLCGAAFADGPQFRMGDDPSWSADEVDTVEWQPIGQMDDDPEGVFWIRQNIELPAGFTNFHDPVLIIESSVSFQLFWNGELVGQSGRVGADSEAEIAGYARTMFGLPPEMTSEGQHMLAIRASSMNRAPGQDFFIEIEFLNMGDLVRNERRWNVLSGFAAGLSLMLAILFAYIAWIRPRQRGRFLLATLLSSAGLMLMLLEIVTQTYSSSYVSVHWLNLLAVFPAVLLYLGIPLFVAMRFQLRPLWLWPALAGLMLAGSFFAGSILPFETDVIAFVGLCGVGVGMGAKTLSSSPRNGVTILAAFAVSFLAILMDADNLNLFLAVFVILFSIELIFDLIIQEITLSRLSAKASRLQVEVLSRHIQPHFIMNSLTTVMELYETRPDEAVLFIEDLAAEFRQFARMADQKLVSLDQELELCRAHAGLMSRRIGKAMTVEADTVDLNASLPPGVLHTLLDNALTHNSYDVMQVVFKVTQTIEGGSTIYVFSAPLGARTTHNENSSGTGARYIHSRLNEAFGTSWSIEDGPVDNAWVTRINIGMGK